MQTKTAVRALLDQLPDDCTIDDVQYHLYVMQAIEQGLADVTNGRVLSHEQVERALLDKWQVQNDG